ncbi:MAG: TPM domain-containing protein [Bacteroidetes bacterium]|nr:TPM domain-containing protein [Bacteroidota bacterium]
MLKFFNPEEEEKIIDAIRQAELSTSGEIRVHLEDNCIGEILKAAIKEFRKLGMHKTEQKNGVLLFLAPERKEFAIIGDENLDKKVPENFWDDVRNLMQRHFKEGAFCDGVCEGVEKVGEKLKAFFPYQSDDVNELPDDISYSS